MKKIFVFAVITVAMSLVSCGATKHAVPAPSYTPNNAQETTPSKPVVQQVTSTELSNCEKAMIAQSPYMRAIGSTRTYDLAAAYELCEISARQSFANRIKSAVLNAAESYLKQIQKNTEVDMERVAESLSQQQAMEIFGGLNAIAIDKTPYPDGTFSYNICYEMTKTKEQLKEDVVNTIVDNIPADVKAQISQDRDSFKKGLGDNLMWK